MNDDYGTVKIFGYDRPFLRRVPVPVGLLCAHCDEPIEGHHSGIWMMWVGGEGEGVCFRPQHTECNLRVLMGSAEHQEALRFNGPEHKCGVVCYEPEGFTKRQNALRAYYYFCDICVHILEYGFPLCRFDVRVPGQWPAGHKWTRIDEAELANCSDCKEALANRVS